MRNGRVATTANCWWLAEGKQAALAHSKGVKTEEREVGESKIQDVKRGHEAKRCLAFLGPRPSAPTSASWIPRDCTVSRWRLLHTIHTAYLASAKCDYYVDVHGAFFWFVFWSPCR